MEKCWGSATEGEWGIRLPCTPHEQQWQPPFAYRQRQTRQDNGGNHPSCIIFKKISLPPRNKRGEPDEGHRN